MVRTVVSPFPTPAFVSFRKGPVGPRSEVGGELHHEDVVVQVSVNLRIDLVGELQDGAGIEVIVDAEGVLVAIDWRVLQRRGADGP